MFLWLSYLTKIFIMKNFKLFITTLIFLFFSNYSDAQIALIDSTYIAKKPNSNVGLFFDQLQRFRGVDETGFFTLNLNPIEGAIGSRWSLTSNNTANLGAGTAFGTGAIANSPVRNWALAGLANSDTLGSSAVQALGDVTVTGLLFFTSDEKLKKDVRDMNSILNDITRLTPKIYKYDHAKIGKVLPLGEQYGFLAQEVKELFPELVTKKYATGLNKNNEFDEDLVEFDAVNYVGMIPILWKGVQEQQTIIDNQQTQISDLAEQLDELERLLLELAAQNNGSIHPPQTEPTSMPSPVFEKIRLQQNQPNPFQMSTTINYFITETEKYASLMIFDGTGQMIQSHNLEIGFETSIEISLEEFPSGIYSYAVSTEKGFTAKQMIYKK